jgi:predicted nuclease with TOPRIM domain
MSPSEYTHLIDFLSKKFDGVDERFERLEGRFGRLEGRFGRLEGRFGRLEVGHEQLRSDLKGVAEGVTMNGERIDRVLDRLDGMDETLRDLAKVASGSD